MRVLKLGAVDLNHSVSVAEKNLCRGFDYVSLAGAGRTQKQHSAKRSRRRGHTRLEDLVQRGDAANRAVLSDYPRAKPRFKLLCDGASRLGVERHQLSCSCVANHLQAFFPRPWFSSESLLCFLPG